MTCPNCGAAMTDGGQSGFICPTPRCENSWYGKLSEDEWDKKHLTADEQARAKRMRAIWRGQRP
jgi:tRNA(Ile2) C34 agmatinyltransferase TiaS